MLVENHISNKGAKRGPKFKDFKLTETNLGLVTKHSLFYAYVRRPTRCTFISLMFFFPINFPLYVSNKQVRHQEVISVHAAYVISRASIWCLAANTTRFLKPSENVFNEKVDRVILFQNYSFPLS